MVPGSFLRFALEVMQWSPPPWARRHLLLGWVLVAATLAPAVALGFVVPELTSRPGATVLVAATVVSTAMAWRSRHLPPFLEVGGGTTIGPVLATIAIHTLAGYVVLIPCAAGLAAVVLLARGMTEHPEARWFVTVLALWLPLVCAPAVGPWWAWRRRLRAPTA
jgi:hypothetical protein